MGVSLNGGFPPISHPKSWSFLVGKPMGLLGKPTILGNPLIMPRYCPNFPSYRSPARNPASDGWFGSGFKFLSHSIHETGIYIYHKINHACHVGKYIPIPCKCLWVFLFFVGGEHLQFNEIFKAITFRTKHGLLLLLTFRQDLLAIFRRP